MNCFLKKLFGKKCDDKKPDNLENHVSKEEEIKESGSDQISPDSEFSPEEQQSDNTSEEYNQ